MTELIDLYESASDNATVQQRENRVMDLLIGIATVMLMSACSDEGRFFNQILCYKPFIDAFEQSNKIERIAFKNL